MSERMNKTARPQAVSTVLIVEDNPQAVELLQAFLEDLPGVSTVTATDGRQAVARIRQAAPDLILLDVMMPKMSGFEVCRRIKGDPATRDIPIVIVTALDADTDYELALECGADDFVRKPINRVELITRVRSLLELRRLRKQLRSAERVGADPDT